MAIDNWQLKCPPSWHLSPTAIPEAFFIERDDQHELPLGKTLEHFSGEIYVQSLSSMLPVLALNPQTHEIILDVAAAPGSKTTFIAQKMKNTGVIVANEPSSSRSAKLASNLERMGIINTIMMQNDGTSLYHFFNQEFDKILLDAPCSSEGYGRKDSSFFQKMWAEKNIFEAAKLQKKLILSAFEMLQVGGTLIYSTCTTAPEENEAVVQHLLDTYPEADLLPIDFSEIPMREGLDRFFEQKFCSRIAKHTRRIWPHLRNKKWNSECFFLAKITKTKPLDRTRVMIPPIKNAPVVLRKNQTAEILVRWQKTFGLNRDIFEDSSLIEKNGEIFLISPEAGTFASKHPHRRCGLPVADKHGNMTSSFAIHFGHFATTNVLELTNEQKDRWMEGYDIVFSPSLEKRELEADFRDGCEVLVHFQNFCLGHGKVQNQGKRLKNKLDRNLVF
ncbi:NOL1/NOP2/sun family putative RNA methylase [Candidatus Gracilibacteria bacterium]|nr:NOL1/NOP2/sun family putative RNA methylase [Candidatus Gracilibacteria bacterium]